MDFFEPIVTQLNARSYRIEASYKTYCFKDIMIKGGGFYAVWDAEKGLWSKNRGDAIRMIDNELYSYNTSNINIYDNNYCPIIKDKKVNQIREKFLHI